MSRTTAAVLCAALLLLAACDSKKDQVAYGHDGVQDAVTLPFHALERAKDSLQRSEDKSKAALEEFEKESKP